MIDYILSWLGWRRIVVILLIALILSYVIMVILRKRRRRLYKLHEADKIKAAREAYTQLGDSDNHLVDMNGNTIKIPRDGDEVIEDEPVSNKLTFRDVFDLLSMNTTSSFNDKYMSLQPTRDENSFESRGERKCRKILRRLTGKDFIKVRPDFLKNPYSGKNLELDCFNQELRCALEYNGIQHYKYTTRFHAKPSDLSQQKRRDAMKRRMCKEAGITLIEVSYECKDLESFIRYELQKNNVKTHL